MPDSWGSKKFGLVSIVSIVFRVKLYSNPGSFEQERKEFKAVEMFWEVRDGANTENLCRELTLLHAWCRLHQIQQSYLRPDN